MSNNKIVTVENAIFFGASVAVWELGKLVVRKVFSKKEESSQQSEQQVASGGKK